jgi:NDP-sugar pyrophosphorylase family protein
MSKPTLLLPAAGKADRFKAVGVNTPKPLIEVCGKTIIEWSLSSIKDLDEYNVVFVVQRSECIEYGLDIELVAKFGSDVSMVILDGYTGGALETCVKAKDKCNPVTPLVIFTPDAMFTPPFDINEVGYYDDGLMPLYVSTKASCSFAKISGSSIIGVAEKKVISPYATVGLYYFRSGELFFRLANHIIDADERVNGEYYIAPIYNRIIKNDGQVGYHMADKVDVLGTPEELEAFRVARHQQ